MSPVACGVFKAQVVPQNVRRHSFGFQGRTFVNGSGIVLIKDMLEARACKGLGTRIEEQFRNARVASNGKPPPHKDCHSYAKSSTQRNMNAIRRNRCLLEMERNSRHITFPGT
jgi:hypothetical protein